MGMKKNIKLWAILIAIAIQSMTTLSVAETHPVNFYYRGTPEQNGNSKHLQAISHFPHSLSIWITATG